MKRYVLLVILVVIIFHANLSVAGEDGLKIHFLDAGEGDCVLIETPNNKKVLVDSGNLITGYNVVEYLKKNNIHTLDYLILTHYDIDHIGGVFYILQMMKVNKIYDNGQDLSEYIKHSDTYRWYSHLVRGNSAYGVLLSGNQFSLDGIKFNILWPKKPFIFQNFNDNSLVVMIKYANRRCLLMGDATSLVETQLLRGAMDLKADILKVGHHGSDDASSLEFLKAVSPMASIISVNDNNVRGYPSRKVISDLKALGTQLYRTDEHGNIIVNISAEGKILVNAKN